MKTILILLTLLIASSAFGQANLTWTDNATNETGFVLERQLNGGPFTVLAAALAANLVSYSDATAVASATAINTYCYRVKAVNTVGSSTSSSAYSNTACKTFPQIPPAIPAAPSALQVSALSQTEIRLSWTDNANNELGIQAERSGNGEVKLLEYAMNSTTAIDKGLTRNRWYEYRIRALGDAGTSAWTNRVKTKTWR